MIEAAAKRNRDAGGDRPDPSLPPPVLRPVRTPLDEHFKTFQQAIDHKQNKVAAGAESLRFTDMGTALRAASKTESADEDTFATLSRALSARQRHSENDDE